MLNKKKSKDQKAAITVVPEIDTVTRSIEFFKPEWEVPTEVGTRGAAEMESLSRSIRKNRRTDGEG